MEIRYFGWSSVAVLHEGIRITFDLDGDISWAAPGGEVPTIFCVTHGHNEHCRSIRDLLDRPETNAFPVHLASSAPIVKYASQVGLSEDQKHILEDGESFDLNGTQVTAFSWKHMSLLPPGLLHKMVHFGRLASRPLDFLRIGLGASKLPRNAPTLGFHIRFPDGKTILNYSEGLHRLTYESEVRRISKEYPADILMFGVEPEDIESIPEWVSILNPREVFIYEPHRLWREQFKMPGFDLNAYSLSLEKHLGKTRVHSLFPGQTFSLSLKENQPI